MGDIIKKGRKKKAREIREGKGVRNNPDGTVSTHRMGDDIIGNTSGKYHVFPTIAPNKSGGYETQSFSQAKDRGEVFEFKNEKRAAKFAAGSWKQGKDKRDAMKSFRQQQRESIPMRNNSIDKLNKNK
jgi:hypothetical protein